MERWELEREIELQQLFESARRRLQGMQIKETATTKSKSKFPIDQIELPGGRVVDLREAGVTQTTATLQMQEAAEKAQFERSVETFKRLGLGEVGARAAAAKGRRG